MSVFTLPDKEALAHWIGHYAIGQLVKFEGIAGGVQNSNFFVTTTLGRYVLTLFENISRADLPYYLNLMAHLARHGLPVPAPIANRDNEYLGTLAGKPAVLVLRLTGSSEMQPTPAHCARIGTMLAGLHLAGRSYGRRLPNPRGAHWRAQTAAQIRPCLNAHDAALLDAEIRFQDSASPLFSRLPSGAIHGDLFRDNVLWVDGFIGGVIDFYFAGHDALLYDVAVAANDWCRMPDGSLHAERANALFVAYHYARPFTDAERAAWPAMLRAAALRFWLSRTADRALPRAGELVMVKEPDEYRDILLQHIQSVPPLPTAAPDTETECRP
ncbi:MAG: homoserine kinase [Azoarcus sp.]|jgi:homoserine kinase type II|nr:homoserine kinase [Azoarcus sp.]